MPHQSIPRIQLKVMGLPHFLSQVLPPTALAYMISVLKVATPEQMVKSLQAETTWNSSIIQVTSNCSQIAQIALKLLDRTMHLFT